jgi:hypothetical protein
MSHPKQDTRYDYDPQREVWRLGDGDGAGLAILKEPAKKSVHPAHVHHSPSRARITAGLSGFFTLIQSREGPDR